MAVRILVADDDAWILHMVTGVLQKRGYAVDTASDGHEAYNKALSAPPDLLITDVMMPKMDGWSLVKALRARAEFSFVPVIFLSALSSDDDRIRGFRLGADDYMPKPFRFEELDLRVARTLRNRVDIEQQARAAIGDSSGEFSRGGGDSGLGGNLAQVGLAPLLTLLEMEQKTGVLVVSNQATGDVARIFLRNGRVVSARTDDTDAPVNQECVFQLLSWRAGRFDFTQKEVQVRDEVQTTTTHLLLEGVRRIDEAR